MGVFKSSLESGFCVPSYGITGEKIKSHAFLAIRTELQNRYSWSREAQGAIYREIHEWEGIRVYTREGQDLILTTITECHKRYEYILSHLEELDIGDGERSELEGFAYGCLENIKRWEQELLKLLGRVPT